MDLSYDFVGGIFVVYDSEGNILPPLDYVDPPTEGDTEYIETALFWYRVAYSPEVQDMPYGQYLEIQNQPVVTILSACTADGVEAGTTQTKSITTESDDGNYRTGFAPTSANQPLQFGTLVTYISPGSSSPQNCWLTFRNVQIPPGARLRKAILKLTAYDYNNSFANSRGTVNATIKGHLSTNSTSNPSIGLLPNDTNFPKTTTVIDWDNIPAWTNDTVYTSPDIACILQEIVNQSGWSSGNAVKIFIENDGSSPSDSSGYAIRSFHSYNSASNKVAQLQYWYSDGYAETTSGGMKIGGSNSPTVTYTYTPVDGIKIGGSLLSDPFELGGIKIGGEADIYSVFPEIGNGGIKIGSNTTVDTAIIPDGGMKIGSNTEVTVTYTVEPTGGIKIGDAYFPNGKRYRVTVTTGPNKVTLGFPVVVRLEYTEGQAIDETDFIVTDTDDNLIQFVVRSFEPTIAYLMFKQNVSASVASVAYVYYGG